MLNKLFTYVHITSVFSFRLFINSFIVVSLSFITLTLYFEKSFADVVYDTTIIPSLVLVLKTLLSLTLENGQKPVAYIASTVRHEDTRDQFLFTLGEWCYDRFNHDLVILLIQLFLLSIYLFFLTIINNLSGLKCSWAD